MKDSTKKFFTTFYRFSGRRIFFLFFIVLFNSGLESLSVLLLIPFFHITKVMPDMPGINMPLMDYFHNGKYGLIIVLLICLIVSVIQEYIKKYRDVEYVFLYSDLNFKCLAIDSKITIPNVNLFLYDIVKISNCDTQMSTKLAGRYALIPTDSNIHHNIFRFQ